MRKLKEPATREPRSAATERRLLEAAGQVFAEKGFRAATIREISQRAGANIAAVNYHFGDKEKLYAATFRHAREACVAQFPLRDEGLNAGSTRDRLGRFVLGLFLRMLDIGRPAWQWQMMAREMIEPTAVLDEMVDEVIRPDFGELQKLVEEITGLAPADERVRRCACSVVGQAMFYRHSQPVVRRLNPSQGFERADLEELADHVTSFSHAALTAMAREGSAKRAGDRAPM